MVLLIDNYDSFVHNLARYIRLLGYETKVVRSDQITAKGISELSPESIVISPGPKSPNEAGVSLECVKQFSGKLPILGVCLGHQTIGAAFGGNIIEAEPMHGRSSSIRHFGHKLFAEIPSPTMVGRYHSLVIERESLPECLDVLADLEDGTIMAVGHRQHLSVGVQFHPESVLSTHGMQVIDNFFKLAKCNKLVSQTANTVTA